MPFVFFSVFIYELPVCLIFYDPSFVQPEKKYMVGIQERVCILIVLSFNCGLSLFHECWQGLPLPISCFLLYFPLIPCMILLVWYGI
jgi:hypothetical protein